MNKKSELDDINLISIKLFDNSSNKKRQKMDIPDRVETWCGVWGVFLMADASHCSTEPSKEQVNIKSGLEGWNNSSLIAAEWHSKAETGCLACLMSHKCIEPSSFPVASTWLWVGWIFILDIALWFLELERGKKITFFRKF